MPALPRISEAEWDVMEVLWSAEAPLTATEVLHVLAGSKDWKANTVKTLLARLVQKKALTFEEEGNRYLYRPLHPRAAFVQAESDTFLHRVFGGAAHPLLLHFASQTKLTPRQAAELRKILEKKQHEIL
jgi:BlaI family penicillinase repressor